MEHLNYGTAQTNDCVPVCAEPTPTIKDLICEQQNMAEDLFQTSVKLLDFVRASDLCNKSDRPDVRDLTSNIQSNNMTMLATIQNLNSLARMLGVM